MKIASVLAAALACPAFAADAPKPKLKPISSSANTAIQSDFPQMQGSGFQQRQFESGGTQGAGLQMNIPASNVRTKAVLAAPAAAPAGPSNAYGSTRPNPLSAPQFMDSQAHQPGTNYAAPQTINAGGGVGAAGPGVTVGPMRPDMVPTAGPRSEPAGVSGGGADAEIATVMSSIEAVEKKIERREKEDEKKSDSKSKEGQGMQPPSPPSGGGEEKKEEGGGGGGGQEGGQQGSGQQEETPSGLAEAQGADARPAANSAALNQGANPQAALGEQPMSAADVATIGEGAAGRQSIIDNLDNIFNDGYSGPAQLRQLGQQTSSALSGGASSAQSAQSNLSTSRSDADTTVDNIGGQNQVNESRAGQFQERAQQLQGVADGAKTDPPECTPKPATFSRPSRGRIDSARKSHGRWRSNMGRAASDNGTLAGHIGTLNATVPQLMAIGRETYQKSGSGNPDAFQPVDSWRKEYINQHNKLNDSLQKGEAAEKDAESALKSSEEAVKKLEETQQQGQTANQSINQLCEQFGSALRPLYDKGKAQEKEGQAKQTQGEGEVSAGEALNAVSPGSGTSLIEQGNNNIKEGQKLEKEGKKMWEKAVEKAEKLKEKMQKKAQKLKDRVEKAKAKAEKARSPHQRADRSRGRFSVPAYMK